MPYISQSAFARLCGISRQGVSKAVDEGRVIKVSKGIDPDNPSNKYFLEKAKVRKLKRKKGRNPAGKRPPSPVAPVPVKVGALPETPEDIVLSEGGPKKKGAGNQSAYFDLFQKAYEETRLVKIKADTAVLKYAKDAGAVVDIETLKRKVGAFANFLVTHLIYMPEDVSALLWMSARSDEDPERKIREILAKRIEVIIQEAKKAAAGVMPPDRGVKYIMLDMEDFDAEERE